MDRNDHRREVADSSFKVTCSRVDRPPAKVVGHPTREVHRLGLGIAACRARQQEQRLHDLPQACALVSDPFQHSPIVFHSAVPTERHLNLAEQRGQGGAELMRGVARESLLPVVGLIDAEERLVLSVQEVVESPAKLLELVASAWCGQSMTQVGRGHRAGSPGHPIQRRQGATQSRRPANAAAAQTPAESTTRVRPSRPRVASTGAGARPTTRTSEAYCTSYPGSSSGCPRPRRSSSPSSSRRAASRHPGRRQRRAVRSVRGPGRRHPVGREVPDPRRWPTG